MEIYQAAQLYKEHRKALDTGYYPHRQVWDVMPFQLTAGVTSYRLRLSSHLSGDSTPIYIHRENGGVRDFRTLDAVAAALIQIGQDKMDFSFILKRHELVGL